MNLAYEYVGKKLIVKRGENYSCYLILGVYKKDNTWYCFYHDGDSTHCFTENTDPYSSCEFTDSRAADIFYHTQLSDLKEFDKNTYIYE